MILVHPVRPAVRSDCNGHYTRVCNLQKLKKYLIIEYQINIKTNQNVLIEVLKVFMSYGHISSLRIRINQNVSFDIVFFREKRCARSDPIASLWLKGNLNVTVRSMVGENILMRAGLLVK